MKKRWDTEGSLRFQNGLKSLAIVVLQGFLMKKIELKKKLLRLSDSKKAIRLKGVICKKCLLSL